MSDYELHAELTDMEAALGEHVEAAIRQSLSHKHPVAARLLSDISECAFDFIEKPDGFDEAVHSCLDGDPEANGNSFGQLEANVAIIKHACQELGDLKSGKKRPKYTEPKGGAGIEETRSLKFSDKANSERLAAVYKDYLRHHKKEWYEWDFTRWRADEKGAQHRAKTVGRAIREELLTDGVTGADMSKHYYRAAKNADSARGIRDALILASSMPEFNGDAIEWDADPWLYNCPNGTVNLETGEVHSHRREDFILSLSPTEYDPEAKAPLWERFLDEVFDGDTELISYLQWALGYSVTGLQTDHVFFICHGSGANGKSTLFQTLNHVLGGDYIHTINSEELMVHKNPRHLAPIAQLKGKRLVVANESSERRRLNEALIKSLCGGDTIRADLKYKDPIEFEPQLKLWFLTNHRPSIQDDSYAMWRRIRLVPFTQEFKGDRADTSLGEKLKGEAAGILAWLIEGAKRVKDGEPELPDAVKAATAEYRDEEDTLATFLSDECETGEHATVTVAALYRAYKAYMNNRCASKIAFGKRVQARGFEKDRPGGKAWLWVGICLKERYAGDLEDAR